MIRTLDHVDLFVSKAAAEVVRMYKHDLDLPETVRIFKDTTASAAPRIRFISFLLCPCSHSRTSVS